MSLKTNKAYMKRLKPTKDGRLLARRKRQDHYNAKESGRERLRKKRYTEFNKLDNKSRARYLPYLSH